MALSRKTVNSRQLCLIATVMSIHGFSSVSVEAYDALTEVYHVMECKYIESIDLVIPCVGYLGNFI